MRPVQRAVVCSVTPVNVLKMAVKSVKLIFGSRITPPSWAKSRTPGADIRKYSPLRPCTTSGVEASGVDPSGVEASGVEASGVEASGVEASGVESSGSSEEQPLKGLMRAEESNSRIRV
jgi:hypothetical protein